MGKQDRQYCDTLIDAVRKFPCLYDYNIKEYNNRELTRIAWENVANQLNDTTANCRKYWRHLRIVYARHLKKDSLTNGNHPMSPTFPYEKMIFLKPFMKSLENQILIPRILSGNVEMNFKEEPEDLTSSTSNLATENDETDEYVGHGNNIEEDMRVVGTLNNQEILERFHEKFEAVSLSKQYGGDRTADHTTASQIPRDHHVASNHHDDYSLDSEHVYETNRKRKCNGANSANSANNKRTTYRLAPLENYRRHYLISLLPDVEEMDPQQYRYFRRKVDELISEIL